ncbi:Myotubularin-related protein 12 [Chelonia mydas]|uniref:Myotubularin-related protein 12 n=1 Tax=Chelonia mydas TaxID=8469 RepID=M7AQ34_CHEMY|nr:Myotubularin-related protein 12 [Chelonia mydas]
MAKKSKRCYFVPSEGYEHLYTHPPPDSLVVDAANRRERQGFQGSTPKNRDAKKLDLFGRKIYSTGGLQLCIANQQAVVSRYRHNACSSMAKFTELLPHKASGKFSALVEEGKLVSRASLQAPLDEADAASRALATGVVMRRGSWLQASGLPHEVQQTIQDLPFEEENASDLCCVISSLVQVMMDSHYRTKFGFQSLIQKEWVMGGHCFLDRCNHLRQNDKEEAPVFLLFLDCVWQLVQQYPPAFEFTETYLTVLSDSLYIPIFSTFFFNSQHQKDANMSGEGHNAQSSHFRFLTVWDWSVQFEPKAQVLLNNPLYVDKPKPDKSQRKTTRFKHHRQLSLPLTQTKSSPKRGFFREETDHFIKNILGKRISKLINSSDELHNNFTEFYDSWHCKPVDFHGLLLPHIEGPGIKVWAQRYLRWIPEAQLLGGGTVATATKILDMIEEVQSLQKKMDEKHSPTVTQGREALPMLRNSARLSSLFPFALLQRHSLKPVLPTSTWKDLEDEDDLAKRDDEFVDLSEVI